jgi:Mrp family chromosome partitioning ATPase
MRKTTMRNGLSDSEAQALRGTIEAHIPSPGAICVTAAQFADATEAVALSVAHAFAAAGHKTLLLDASGSGIDADDDEIAGLPEIQSAAAVTDSLHAVARLGKLRVARLAASACDRLRSDEVKAIVADLRAQYSTIVVNVGESASGGTALFFAREVDAVVVSIRLGRAATRDDRVLLERLAAVGANILGVVPVAARAKRGSNRRLPAGDQIGAPALHAKARLAR